MSVNPHRLLPALDAARSNEERAARTVAARRIQIDERSAQLQQLQRFRAEYALRLDDEARQGVFAHTVQRYGEFLARLDDSIRHAQHGLAGLRAEFEAETKSWVEARAKSKALDTLIARQQDEAARTRARREQAETDDHAQRSGWKARERR